MTHYKRKKRKNTGLIIKRVLLTILTFLLLLIIAVYSAGLMITHGPSESFCKMLVISAKQASATKWAPYLFLSKSKVDQIMSDSKKVNVDIIDAGTYTNEDDAGDDSTDINGLKLIYLTKPRFKAYLLIVKDPARVKVGVSSENFESAEKGMRIFDIAKKYNAFAAINAGEFSDVGGQGSGAAPMGLTFSMGKMVWKDSLKRTFIGFDSNNKLICKEGMTAKEAQELGIRDAVSFQNGNVLIDSENGKVKIYYADDNTGVSQRTAIAQREDGTVLMLVTDGRSADSIGANRNDVIDILLSYGAVSAGMLDGGSSAMLYYRDYYDIYNIDKTKLEEFQIKGLVNKYKAFVSPRTMPTYFIVTE